MAPFPYVREAFDKPGRISGIAVEAASGTPVAELRGRLDRGLGDGLQAERSETRTQEISGQLQGFRLSLLFFAGTALFVGAFLVFNALSMTILERTRELGMLRALGSTRGMIARSVVVEALILGVLGSLLGVLLRFRDGQGPRLPVRPGIPVPDNRRSSSPPSPWSRPWSWAWPSRSWPPFILRCAPGRVSPVEAMRSRASGGGQAAFALVSALAPLLGLALLGIGAPWIYYLAKNLSADLDGLVYASGIAGVIGAFLGVSLIVPILVRPLAAFFSPTSAAPLRRRGKDGRGERHEEQGKDRADRLGAHGRHLARRRLLALGGSVLGSIRSYLEGSLGSDYVVQPASQNSDVTFSARAPAEVGGVPGVEKTTSLASTFLRDGDEVEHRLRGRRELPRHLPRQLRSRQDRTRSPGSKTAGRS